MEYKTLLYEVKAGVAHITLNRPDSYNALNLDLINELKDVFKAVAKDQNARSIILTGSGKGFSSGADLVELGERLTDISITEVLRSGLNLLVAQMRSLEKPIVCAVNGVAAGAGASLALAADHRIASENASFVFAAFVNIGLVPDGGATYLLQQYVGPAKALELALFADAKNRLTAQSAFELGILNRVVSPEQLTVEAEEVAGRLANMATKAVGLTKKAIYRAYERSLVDSLDYEAQVQAATYKTHDFQEGVTAFLEKRAPVFKGA